MLNLRQFSIVFYFYLRKILEDDSGWAERNLDVLFRVFDPVEDLFDVSLLDTEVVAVADGTLEEHSN